MQFDSSGYLTYAPNNLLLNSATLATQTVTVQSGVNYLMSIEGTGSVTLSGASTAGPLTGTGAGNRVDLKITASTSALTITVSGSVTSARLSAVTYETAFRSGVSTDASGRSIVANGGAVSSDGNRATPVAVTSAYLGSFNGAYSISGPVKSFAIYNQRLPDATLQAKSVVGASY